MVIIHCFLNNFVINVDIEPSSRLSCLLHQITSECVFSNVLMQNQRHENRKTSDWSKSVVRYMDDTDSDILGLGFLITSSIMWISNRGHVFCVRGIRLHPTGVFRMCWWQRSDTIIEKHLTGQKVIVPYVEDTNSDILFTIKVIEMIFCRDVYGVRLYLPTRFEPGIARNTEVIADRTIWDKWTDGNYSLFP